MLSLCRITPVTCVVTAICLKISVEGVLYTRDGKKVYSFQYPFVVESYNKLNFNRCVSVSVGWHNSEAQSANLALRLTGGQLFDSLKYGKLNYSAQMLPGENAIYSSMSVFVEGRNQSDQQYNIRISLSCFYIDKGSFVNHVLVEESSIYITLRYCPQTRQTLLKYERKKSFNDLSKVHCDDGAMLFNGTEKLSLNKSVSKCGPFGEWLDNFSCWFAPTVQLRSLPAAFYKKGDNIRFYCNVSEGYQNGSSSQLLMGDQKWPTKNNFTMVKMTELHNNKSVRCVASNAAGISYSNSQTMIVYFPLMLESHTHCPNLGESNYSLQFFSNPPQNSSSLRFILQVGNSTNATIEGIWKEENTSRYGTRLQKFTASINLTKKSTLFFEYDKYGVKSSEKLDIAQNCSLAPEVRLISLPAAFYKKGDNIRFYCNVSEGYPNDSYSQLLIGNQKWPTKNNFTVVKMTELHNNKSVRCVASNAAGISYSNSQTMIVYFPLILESHTHCPKLGESIFFVQFFSNPPQNSSSLRFILQDIALKVGNSTNATIEGIWKEENTSRYGTWLQKFTASINLTKSTTLFFEYDKYGVKSSEKLDIAQNCSLVEVEETTNQSYTGIHTTDDYTYSTIGDTANDAQNCWNSSITLYAVGGALGLWLLLTVPAIAILVKQKQTLARKVKDHARADINHSSTDTIGRAKQGQATDQPGTSTNLKSAETDANSTYVNVAMSSPYENIDTSSRYETVAA